MTFPSRPASSFDSESHPASHAHASGVSWGAVLAGAVAGAALSLILLALGTGLGLSSISPWSNTGISATALGTAAIIWIIVTQVAASALGGYLAGRLRTRWATLHTDEVYFRDTAHGLLSWSVAMVVTAGLLTSAAASMAGSVAQGGAQMAGSAMSASTDADPNAYYVDGLMRSTQPANDPNAAAVRSEVGKILANALRNGNLPADDSTYLASVVASHTGLTQAQAEQRVSAMFTNARRAADTARKSAAHLSLWLFIALLAGAFTASVAATIGGRQRDNVQTV